MKSWKIFWFKLLIVWAIFFIQRLVFIGFNYQSFPSLNSDIFFKALLLGARFDATTVIYYQIPFIILWIIAGTWITSKKIHITLNLFYYLGASIAFFIEAVDLALFPFNFKRMTTEIFSLLSTVPSMGGNFLFEYWYVIGIWIILILILFISNRRLIKLSESRLSPLKSGLWFFIHLIVLITLFRGGWQKRPLKPMSAGEFIDVNFISIVTNSPFTFAKSIGRRSVPIKNYYSHEVREEIYSHKAWIDGTSPLGKKRNVFLILVESLGKEMVGALNNYQGYTPFFDELISKSIYFPDSFANGRRSNEGLVSIFASLPMLMDDPFMHSMYAGNKFLGLGQILKSHNYKSYFFNGSPKNLLAWSEFLNASGIQEHISREDYPDGAHDDGRWGIYDHYFLPWVAKSPKLNSSEPFFASVFTISSHHPYLVPKEFHEKVSEKNPYLLSIRYTDEALRKFFAEAEKQSWFKNTIFIITADHTGSATEKSGSIGSESDFYKNRVGIYSVPFVIFDPQYPVQKIVNSVAQQTDILPTVLDLIGYTGKYFSFGESVFKTDRKNFVVHFVNGLYSVLNDQYILTFDGEKSIDLFNYKNDPNLKINLLKNEHEIVESFETYLKAYIQTYYYGLVKNQLSYD